MLRTARALTGVWLVLGCGVLSGGGELRLDAGPVRAGDAAEVVKEITELKINCRNNLRPLQLSAPIPPISAACITNSATFSARERGTNT